MIPGGDFLLLLKYSSFALNLVAGELYIHISYSRIIAFLPKRKKSNKTTTTPTNQIFAYFAYMHELWMSQILWVDNNAINHHFLSSLLLLLLLLSAAVVVVVVLLRLPTAISKFNNSAETKKNSSYKFSLVQGTAFFLYHALYLTWKSVETAFFFVWLPPSLPNVHTLRYWKELFSAEIKLFYITHTYLQEKVR